jgi:hypothetical protein
MSFFDDLTNITPDPNTVTPDPNTVTPGANNVTPGANNVAPGLTRGPFSKPGEKMKEQNGFRIKSGMTCAQLTTVRTQ